MYSLYEETIILPIYNAITESQKNYTQFVVEPGCGIREAGFQSQALLSMDSLSLTLIHWQLRLPFLLQDLALYSACNRGSVNICYRKGWMDSHGWFSTWTKQTLTKETSLYRQIYLRGMHNSGDNCVPEKDNTSILDAGVLCRSVI